MRRLVPVLVLACVLSSIAGPAAGQEPPTGPDLAGTDLPAGFVDGIAVGSDGSGDRVIATVDRAAPGPRYFGDGAWAAIEAAAAATPRSCSLSNGGLTALVASPIFKESSAATTPASAPSPMTLSRYDEWNGVYATTSNQSANYGLYEGRDPYTPYFRAYWHPGIGIWQYDSAGVGAPYTAAERMDVRVVAGDVAAGMAQRYCNPAVIASVMGPGPYTDQQRRDAAWWPWWGTDAPRCPLCQVEFDNMTGTSPQFARINKVGGISATGGAVRRTCQLGGAAVECWYVNPSVGVIEGATFWATLAPHGNNNPTVQPAPLSHPFYVVKRDGFEERHWLRSDTGYPFHISARRQLGRNARPRSNQPGSGLDWARTSGLCDPTRGSAGNCGAVPPPPPPPPSGPVPPAGISSAQVSVGGTYRPVHLDANGDGRGDVFWYAPGPAADHLWLGQGGGRFTSLAVPVGGHYDDVVALDANGDGRDDLLFYARSGSTSYLWTSNGNGTFASQAILPGGGRVPVVGDFDGDRRDEVLWYGPGAIADVMWHWTATGVVTEPASVGGAYQPVVGDFDGNGRDDILWYRNGPGADYLWLRRAAGGHLDLSLNVGAGLRPHVGDVDGDGRDDLVWYGPGAAGDSVWFGAPQGAFATQTFTVSQAYVPVVTDLGGDGRDDVVWYGPGGAGHLWTRWGADRSRTSVALEVPGGYTPIGGLFSPGRSGGILWYAPGPAADWLWHR